MLSTHAAWAVPSCRSDRNSGSTTAAAEEPVAVSPNSTPRTSAVHRASLARAPVRTEPSITVPTTGPGPVLLAVTCLVSPPPERPTSSADAAVGGRSPEEERVTSGDNRSRYVVVSVQGGAPGDGRSSVARRRPTATGVLPGHHTRLERGPPVVATEDERLPLDAGDQPPGWVPRRRGCTVDLDPPGTWRCLARVPAASSPSGARDRGIGIPGSGVPTELSAPRRMMAWCGVSWWPRPEARRAGCKSWTTPVCPLPRPGGLPIWRLPWRRGSARAALGGSSRRWSSCIPACSTPAWWFVDASTFR